MRIRANFEYRLSPEKFKEKFPQIEGHLKEAIYDNRDNTIVIKTEIGYYSDDQIKIWKELGDTPDKDIFIAVHKKTEITTEGKTEEEAKEKLVKKVQEYNKERDEKSVKVQGRR